MRTTIKRIGFIALSLWGLVLLPLTKTWGEGTDFDIQASSLTDKARAKNLRAASLEELAKRYPNESFPLLVTLFKDPNEETFLRHLAGEKLAAINRSRAIREFREILETPKEDPLARRMALASLASLDEANIKGKVRSILDNVKEDAGLRQYALALYSQGDDPAKMEKLRRIVQSRRETLSLRGNALFLLESLEDSEFVLSTLHRILTDRSEDLELRKNGIVMAERLGDRDALPLLKRLANNPAEASSLRQLATSSLKRLEARFDLGSGKQDARARL